MNYNVMLKSAERAIEEIEASKDEAKRAAIALDCIEEIPLFRSTAPLIIGVAAALGDEKALQKDAAGFIRLREAVIESSLILSQYPDAEREIRILHSFLNKIARDNGARISLWKARLATALSNETRARKLLEDFSGSHAFRGLYELASAEFHSQFKRYDKAREHIAGGKRLFSGSAARNTGFYYRLLQIECLAAQMTGRIMEAIGAMGEGLEMVRSYGFAAETVQDTLTLANLELYAGKTAEASALMEEGLREARKASMDDAVPFFLQGLAAAYERQGRLEEALAAAEEGAELCREKNREMFTAFEEDAARIRRKGRF
ncbi:MAG: hypothetical protein FJ088_01710 [Deltaproteobacteria bacterium]|nr:hypothetical protein [Deltaproteobacteria bacterium]